MGERIPSETQARFLARMWGVPHNVQIPDAGWRNSTVAALLRNDWIEHGGSGGKFPNGDDYTNYGISEKGIDALESFFRQRRYKRADKP